MKRKSPLINADKQKLEEKKTICKNSFPTFRSSKSSRTTKRKSLRFSPQKNAEIAKLTKALNTNWQRYKTTLEEYQQTEAKSEQ